MAGLGLEAAGGVQGAWEALHQIISERKKQELLADVAASKQREEELQALKFMEDKRQFDITSENQRRQNEALMARYGRQEDRQQASENRQEAQTLATNTPIGANLTAGDVGALKVGGLGGLAKPQPILTMPGIVSKLGGAAEPSTETGGGFKYTGNAAQQQAAANQVRLEADAKARAEHMEQLERDAQTRLGQSEQRIENALGAQTVTITHADENGNVVTEVLPKQEALAHGPYAATPTAETRNRQAAMGRARPVLDSISELSEKINTGKGLAAKATGYAAQQAAKANLNDDVAEYESLISGFTPLVARALGHTGVLTEQDVQSVRNVFPKPGDSKSLRDRKIARIFKLIGGEDPTGATDGGGSKHLKFDAQGNLQ